MTRNLLQILVKKPFSLIHSLQNSAQLLKIRVFSLHQLIHGHDTISIRMLKCPVML